MTTNDDYDYKKAKEAFVSDIKGSSVLHVNLVSLAALTSLALYSTFRSASFAAQWLLLVLPLLLSITLFANRPLLLSALLIAPTSVRLLRTRSPHGTRHPDPPVAHTPLSPSHTIDIPPGSMHIPAPAPASVSAPTYIAPLPALTAYRAHMLLLTVLAILAVDFPVFPRALAKTETFGVSLMDLGVASFVFSQGLVSAIPILRAPAHLAAPPTPKLRAALDKSIPLLLIGTARVVMVKGTAYPEHASEYGVHWNFFFTLAFLPMLQIALHPLLARAPISLVGALVACAHQLALSMTPLQRYTLHAPRTGMVSMNKEGIVSLPGYLAIHLVGLSVGTIVLPPSPSAFRRRQQQQQQQQQQQNRVFPVARSHTLNDVRLEKERTRDGDKLQSFQMQRRQDGKTAIELFSYAVLWWTFFGLARLGGVGAGVSRRLANLPYVLWTSAFNTSFVLGYLLLDMTFGTREAPPLLVAINRNGLAVFLLANVATGIVNLCVETMYASDAVAMGLLSAYAVGVCGAAWALRGTRLW